MNTVLTIIITQAVVVFTFFFLHYKVDPMKEKKKNMKEQLIFYGKLYANISARGALIINIEKQNGRDLPKVQCFGEWGSAPEHLKRKGMEELIFENASYCTLALLDAWTQYVSRIDRTVDQETVDKLSKEIVVQYNILKKKLGYQYNEAELRTGIPEVYSFLRKLN